MTFKMKFQEKFFDPLKFIRLHLIFGQQDIWQILTKYPR